jgi:peptidoglycan glycosyltransferase
MSKTMRRVAASVFVLLAVLAAWLTVQQTLAGSTYRDDPRNARALPDPDDPSRGPIVTADGVVVAEDVDGLRTYPHGDVYFHAVGFVGETEAAAGVELTRAADLQTLDDGSLSAWLVELFGGSVEPPEVRLTIVDRVQRAAASALAGRTGTVVALDPATGAVLAYAASPALDPNDVSSGSIVVTDALSDPASLDRATFRLLPPGSTFKVLVAAAALEAGYGPDSTFTDSAEYLAPGAGSPITNVTGGTCGDGSEITLREALAVSCNTVFAALAVELGGGAIVDVAFRAGFNEVLPFELGAAISSLPTAIELDADPGALAQTGLGERDVRVTPLQMATIAAALGNGGEIMQPRIVDRVVSRDGTTLERTATVSLGSIVDPGVAADVVSMMEDVVTAGTGRAADLGDIAVAGKTGTAEGAGGPHAWFIALAPAENPTIALAVVVEGEGTGGTTAAPIAASVLRAWFGG